MTSWKPILTGERAALAGKIIDDISAEVAVAGPDQRPDPFRILLDAYLARTRDSDELAERALVAMEGLVASVQPYQPTGLFGGLSGIGWMTEHLTGLLADWIEPDEEDPCEELDLVLQEFVKNSVPQGNYDLISGHAGIATYAAERLSHKSARDLLAVIVDKIAADSQPVAPGISWHTPGERLPEHQRVEAPDGYYNLGVAHGVPALAVVLALAAREGIEADRARPLLEGTMSWLFAQRTPVVAGQGGYPAWIPTGRQASSGSREAWCYGGLGVAATLLLASRYAKNEAWEATSLDIGRQEASRAKETAGVRDACVCHGSSGNAHLYNRLYQATGDETFREAALAWYDHCFKAYKPGQGVGGYLFWTSNLPDLTLDWRPNSSFLSGSVGVGLALIAATTEVEPNWDRVLMCDVR